MATTQYTKRRTQPVTVGEAASMAEAASAPAIVGARFAVVVSALALLVATVAMITAVVR